MTHRLLSPMLSKVGIWSVAMLTAFTTTAQPQPSYARNTTFFCAQSKGVPVTFARTLDGRKMPMIRWVKSKDLSSNLTPLQRCQQVSRRFQINHDNQKLRTMITGTLNGLPVVCAATSTNDTCTENNLLFTLKRGSNARLAVERLLDRRGLAAGQIQNQGGSDGSQIYIDFDTYLNGVQPER